MWQTVVSLERSFAELCISSYPHEWEENHISFQLMKRLRETFSYRILSFNSWSKIVDWQSFKLRGKRETNYGDIALLLNIQFSSGEVLKGVANIEAKRIYDTGNFKEINLDQSERILANLPYSHLLLYYFERNIVPLKFPNDSNWETHMLISPLNTANQLLKQIKTENWKVERVSLPFSMFLTSRVFWGHDLDYRADVIQDIEQGIGEYSKADYLGVVNVYYEGQKPVAVNLSEIWEPI
jgi:hypothetical protein